MRPLLASAAFRHTIAAGILVVHMATVWVARAPGVLTRQDDANYLLLAESLESLHYRDNYLVGAPLHRKYPPGYPAFLTVLDAIPGDRANVAIATNIVLSAATLALAFAFVRPVFGHGLALAGLAVTALNPFVIDYAGMPNSEALYTLLSLAALVAFVRARSPVGWILAAALAISAALTRAIGLTAVLALAAAWLIRRRGGGDSAAPERGRRYQALLVAGAIALPLGTWLVFSIAEPLAHPGWSYAADFTVGSQNEGLAHLVVRRVTSNVPVYLGSFIPSMLPLPMKTGATADNLIGTALVVAGLGAGAVVLTRAGLTIVPIYLLVYLGLLAVWPYQELRYLVPLLPLVIPVVLGGLPHAARRLGKRVAAPLPWVVAGILVFFAVVSDRQFIREYGSCTRNADGLPDGPCLTVDQASFFAALAHVQGFAPADAVFLAAKPEPLFYYARRRSVDLRPLVLRRVEPWPYLQASGVSWILLGGLKGMERTMFPDWLEPHCRQLALEGFFPPRTYLLRVLPDSAAGDSQACGAIAEFRATNARMSTETKRPR